MKNVACELNKEMMTYSKNGLKITDCIFRKNRVRFLPYVEVISKQKFNIKYCFKRIFSKYYSEEDLPKQNTTP